MAIPWTVLAGRTAAGWVSGDGARFRFGEAATNLRTGHASVRLEFGMDAIALTRTLLIVCLFGLGPITTDLYLPALPLIGRELGGSVADVQLTLSIYLFGFAAAQLVLGPLSDRLGRKPVLLAGLFVYLLGSLGCMLAPNISLLVLARLVQAVGACSGPVVGRAMIRDLYAPPDMARILAYVSSAMAIAPMLGPVIGGWLTVWFGWRANFAALLSIALVLAACAWRWLPESNAHRDPLATSPARIVGNFRTLFADRVFVGYSLCFGAAYGALFSFISGSSFVFIEIYRVPPQWYGASFALAVLGYIFGALMSGRLASRAPADAMIRVGGALGAAAALAMLPLAALGGAWAVLLAAFVCMVGIGLVMPTSSGAALVNYPRMAGSASALVGCTQMTLAASVGLALGHAYNQSPAPMALAMFACHLLVLASHRLLVGRAGGMPASPRVDNQSGSQSS